MDFNINSYPELKEAIESDNLVLFVGAGCSLKLKNKQGFEIGNWENLVEKILEHLQNKGYEVAHLQKALKTKSALEILQFLESFSTEIGKNIIYEFTDRFLELDDNSTINDFSFHNLLAAVSSKVITTNYDRAFEIANSEVFKNCVIKGDDSKIERIKKDSNFLLKLHGCYTRERTMVLFKSDYENLYGNDQNLESKHLLTCLTNLFYNKTMLFIGYGMGDEEINLILKNIQKVTHQYSHKHYIITKDKLNEELRTFLTHIPISEFNELPLVVNKLIEVKNKYNIEIKDKYDIEKKRILLELGGLKGVHKNLILELFEEARKFCLNNDFESAIIKFRQCSSLEENDFVYNNWGLAICSNAFSNKSEIECNEEAILKYKKAIDLNRKNFQAYSNWGNSLLVIGKASMSENIFLEGIEKFEISIKLSLENPIALCNMAICLFYISKLKNGKEKEKLILESLQYFNSAEKKFNLNGNMLQNYGVVLYNLAKLKIGKERENLFLESEVKLIKALQLGCGLNHIAALYFIWNKRKESLQFLEMALVYGHITSIIIDKEDDWKNYKKDEDFKTLLYKYRE